MKQITKYFRAINSLLTKQIDSTGLAFFRIAYSAILICEIVQIIYFRHLIYDKIPFILPAEINVLPGLIVWLVAVLCVLLGVFTRKAALVNYVLSLVFIGTIKSYEYHVFYTYMGVNFLFLFLDISKNHSIDRLIKKWKYSTARFTYDPPKTVGVWHYYIAIAVGVGFVYFDSIFFKFASYNWMNGLGMWLPASLPMATQVDASFFLNMKWLALGLGYLTILFELLFLFTFFLKKFRIPLLIVGAGLHLGIIIIFPIPWFGLSVLSIYLMMIPVGFWRKLSQRTSKNRSSLTVYFDEECPLCNRTKIAVQHFDYRRKIEWKGVSEADEEQALEVVSQETLLLSMHGVTRKGKVVNGIKTYQEITKRIPIFYPLYLLLLVPGISHLAAWLYGLVAANRTSTRCTDETCGYMPPEVPMPDEQVKVFQNVNLLQLKSFGWGVLFLLLVLLQLNVSFHSKLVQDGLAQANLTESAFYSQTMKYSRKLWGVGKILFGITRHGVFMDGHFAGYNHIMGVEAEFADGTTEWLPMINKDGTAGWYDYSFLWVKWTFRVMDNEVDEERLHTGLRDFCTFWAIKNGKELDDVRFNIYLKQIDMPRKWEKDFLRLQKQKEWEKIGIAYWDDGSFFTNYPVIENFNANE